jgi:hypothetical protein
MWNWIKITSKKDDLPPFNHVVMLYWKKDGKKYATTGCLRSLDADGYHWSTNDTMINIFDFLNVITDKELKPTHYCEIETPEDENDKPPVTKQG